MKRLLSLLLLAIVCSGVQAQKVYFLYLQSEPQQAFFVRMNEKTFSSTASGYLILPKMKDSSYAIRIGFPNNKWPEQSFSIDVKGKDRGLLLKQFEGKGWGLFDLQTLSVQMASTAAGRQVDTTQSVSSFTSTLSKAANDPSLLERPLVVKEAEKPAPKEETVKVEDPVKKAAADSAVVAVNKSGIIPQTANTDTVTKKTETANSIVQAAEPVTKPIEPVISEKPLTTEVVKDTMMSVAAKPTEVKELPKEELPVKKEEVKAVPVITSAQETSQATETAKGVNNEGMLPASKLVKKAESSTSAGFGLTYVDQYTDGKTDTIKIVIPNPPLVIKPAAREDKRFLDISSESKDSPAIGTAKVKPAPSRTCTSVAREADFLKLRKKMAGIAKDDGMIEEAKKAFKSKCYMSEQVKNLGTLFLNEAGKFQFYEAAYPFVVDPDQFIMLKEEFKDNYFVHRFNNLLKK